MARYPIRRAKLKGVAHLAATEHVIEAKREAVGASSLAAAYATLFKLRVSVMVIVTAAAGLYLGDLRSGVNPFHLQALFALAGIALVTCGSSALNQALERKS